MSDEKKRITPGNEIEQKEKTDEGKRFHPDQ
jgi:hypothetical protein